MRLTLVWSSAPRLPTNIVSTARIQKAQNQKWVAAGTLAKMRSSSAKVGGLWPGGEERGNRSGRAFVNVRRPNLERCGGHFEAQADQNQRKPELQRVLD